MRSTSIISAAAMAAALCALPAEAAAAKGGEKLKPHFHYYLPKSLIVTEVRQQLTGCPPGKPPQIATQWSVTSRAVPDPDRLVVVDASNAFLTKRSTALALRPDGTLESFNASQRGEGGAVLTSLLKLGLSVATLGAGGMPAAALSSSQPAAAPTRPTRVGCKQAIRGMLATIDELGQKMGQIEARVLLGTAIPADLELADRLRARRSALRDALTLKGSATHDPTGRKPDRPAQAPATAQDVNAGAAARVVGWRGRLDRLDYDQWFDAASPDFEPDSVPGQFGWAVVVASVPGMAKAVPGVAQAGSITTAAPRLAYLRPVSASIQVGPCTTADDPCALDTSDLASPASANGEVVVPQWSPIYSVSVGRRRLFGSRELSAKFDPFGAPLALSYGSDSGAADLSSTVDAATTAVTDLRDMEVQAIERQIKLEEARRKLRDLQTSDE